MLLKNKVLYLNIETNKNKRIMRARIFIDKETKTITVVESEHTPSYSKSKETIYKYYTGEPKKWAWPLLDTLAHVLDTYKGAEVLA